jgi:hypothetical protein
MVLLCSPLIAFSAVQYAWFSLRGPGAASFADKKTAAWLPVKKNAPRVVWMVFVHRSPSRVESSPCPILLGNVGYVSLP